MGKRHPHVPCDAPWAPVAAGSSTSTLVAGWGPSLTERTLRCIKQICVQSNNSMKNMKSNSYQSVLSVHRVQRTLPEDRGGRLAAPNLLLAKATPESIETGVSCPPCLRIRYRNALEGDQLSASPVCEHIAKCSKQ